MRLRVKSLVEKYSNISAVAKATFWFFFCNILNKCISMITTPIFTRILSTDQFGVFNTFQSWAQILTILVTLRLDYGVFNKGMSKYPEGKDDYTATMQCLTSVLTLIVLSVYLIFHRQINKVTGLSTFLSIALFTEVFFYSAVPFWTLRQRYDFKYKAVVLVSIGLSLLQTILGVLGVLLTKRSGLGRILAYLFVNACFGICIYIFNFKNARHRFVKEYAKFALIFNLPLLPHYFSSYILDQFDRIMIQHMVGYSAVGIYGIAYSCGYVIKIVTSSLNTTLIPWMYRQLQKKNFEILRSCVKSITECVLLCFMGYMAFAPEIVKIFAPSDYGQAVYAIAPITCSAFLIFIYELYGNVEVYYNSNKVSTCIAICGAVLNIILNYICISIWGFLAAAYTTLASYIFFAAAHFIYVSYVTKKYAEVKLFPLPDFLKALAVIVLYGLCINLLYSHTAIRYIWICMMLLYVFIHRKKIFHFMSLLR